MGLRAYITKRIIFSLILVIFVLTINFIIFELMPGNPIEVLAGRPGALEAGQVEKILALWGFDKPLHERYFKYIQNMLTFELGISFYSRAPVGNQIANRLLNTVLLTGGATILSMIIGIFLGVLVAYKRGGKFDNLAVIVALTTYSLPSFWMGMVFILIFYKNLHWFPAGHTFPAEWTGTGNWPEPLLRLNAFGTQIVIPGLTEISGRLYHLALPLMTLTLFSYGGYLLLTRAAMLETLTEDYIVTARAKGLKERTVLFKHALKNASLPLVTNIALSFGFLLTGAIITEQVFTYPGLGKWIWDAVQFRDYPVLQAIFYIIGLCVIIANFIADLVYGIIDPRIKYG